MKKKFIRHSKILDRHEYIRVGDKVAVVDGSYMTDENGNPVPGIYFKEVEKGSTKYEILTVSRVNIPFKTSYEPLLRDKVLGHHNNCEIKGFDDKKYHCSYLNIRKLNNK